MAEGLGGHPGGIAGLLRLLDEHGEAVEYDLISLGLRLDDLGTPALSWRDLLVIVTNLPRTSALARDIVGEDALWGVGEHLLATVVDVLQQGNWQRGQKPHAPRPKPVKRPGAKSETKTYGSDPIPIADFDAWWYGDRG